MTDSIAEFTAQLVGTPFESLPLERAEVPGGEWSFETTLDAHTTMPERVALWRAALGMIEVTGRYPVLLVDPGPNAYSRSFYAADYEQDTYPEAIIAASKALIGSEVSERLHTRWPSFDAPDHEFRRDETARLVGSAPSVAELAEGCDVDDDRSVERFLLDWEEARKAGEPTGRTGSRAWAFYDEPNILAWLPVRHAEETAAYLHFWGGGDTAARQAEFQACLRSWRERFDAHVVCVWIVTMDLWIGNPPTDLETAFTWSTELDLFLKPNESIRQRARDLVGCNEIELYDRP